MPETSQKIEVKPAVSPRESVLYAVCTWFLLAGFWVWLAAALAMPPN
jgi:hypothetical protein